MTSAVEIHVIDSAVVALMLGGQWFNVDEVVVSFADYTITHQGGPTTVNGVGLHVRARIRQGPNVGEHIIAELGDVQALRVA